MSDASSYAAGWRQATHYPDPAIHALQQLADSDGNAALARADAALRDTAVDRTTAIRRAWLQAVRGQSFSALELDPDARDAATEDLARLERAAQWQRP